MNLLDENPSRLSLSLHEAGQIALVYWRAESLHERLAYLYPGRSGKVSGRMIWPCFEINEWSLMILMAGHLADLLAGGFVPTKAMRHDSRHGLTQGDSRRIKRLVMLLCHGKDDRHYNFEVQERTRAILQKPAMWNAVQILAASLYADGSVNGEDCESIFRKSGAETWLD
jgi:hypothetical protein